MRRRHVAAPTHQMATVPDAFADYGTRLSINRRECGNERRKQDERYEFAHGSILRTEPDSQLCRTACLAADVTTKWAANKQASMLPESGYMVVTQKQMKKKGYTPKRVTL